ncbi:MAG: Fic family protein [Gemmatimonadaceae bacterium]
MHFSAAEPLLLDPARTSGDLADLALALEREAAALEKTVPESVRESIADLMRVTNSYYSNRIEGNDTRPSAIVATMKRDDLPAPARALQRQAWAHVEVEKLAEAKLANEPDLEPCSENFLRWLHREFYSRVDDSLRWVENADTGRRERVNPGEIRKFDVTVGRHLAPEPDALEPLLRHAASRYRSGALSGLERTFAFAASHHRLMWIHPFGDGNGRVVRLATAMYGRKLGLGALGLWTPSRGLARNRDGYLSAMARADALRRNELDGRGSLSLEALEEFVRFFLETCLDQVRYMSSVLALDELGGRLEAYARLRAERVAKGPAGALRPEAGRLLRFSLVAGEMSRGEAPAAAGVHSRIAYNIVRSLLDDGLLWSPSPRGPLRLRVPLHAVRYLLPELYPEGVE